MHIITFISVNRFNRCSFVDTKLLQPKNKSKGLLMLVYTKSEYGLFVGTSRQFSTITPGVMVYYIMVVKVAKWGKGFP